LEKNILEPNISTMFPRLVVMFSLW